MRHLLWSSISLLITALAGISSAFAAPESSEPSIAIRPAFLKMRDGVKLSVTYYLPGSVARGARVPIVLELLPYRKDDDFMERDFSLEEYFARHGIAIARVDLRGTGSSEGHLPDREYSEIELRDSEEILGQLSRLPYSTGKVGMQGISWGGFNAIQVAMRRPPALAAILACDATDDLYHDDIHFIDGIFHVDEYALDIDHANGLPQSPAYKIDANYFKNRFNATPWIFTYKAHQRDGAWWSQHSLRFQKPLEVPSFLIGGLLDGYRDSVSRMLEKSKAPVKALIGPWPHAWPDDTEPGPGFEWRTQAVKWWKYWLGDEKNDALSGARLTVFVRAGNAPDATLKTIPGEWRQEDWPIARKQNLTLYPSASKSLSEKRGTESLETLKNKPSAGAAAGYWWGENTGDLAEADRSALVYDTAPLEKGVEIIGNPAVRLQASATGPLAHWVVRLEDVSPDGKVALVTGGAQNGAQRESRLKPKALVPGKFYELSFPLHFTTWTFQPGHRIRLAISNGAFPMLWPTPAKLSSQLRIDSAATAIALPVIPFEARARVELEKLEPRRSSGHNSAKEISTWSVLPELSSKPADPEAVFRGSGESEKKVGDLTLHEKESTEYAVDDENPANAHFVGTFEHGLNGKDLDLKLDSKMEVRSDTKDFVVSFTRTLFEQGKLKRQRTWTKKIPRDYQ